MDSHGGFHEVEKDGKLSLVYHHPKYNPIPQAISGEAVINNTPSQLHFLCPVSRWEQQHPKENDKPSPFNSSPTRAQQDEHSVDHHVLPLFWCNNKEFDVNGGCDACEGSNFGTYYYLCECHNLKYHKECVESPPKIKHPYHPQHSLQLYFFLFNPGNSECLCCGREAYHLVYYCTICRVFMHTICAMNSIPFVIDQPKRHNHPLTFFPRQTSLTCNVCGLLCSIDPTYVCLRCNFVAHRDCMYFPRVIKISRHHHRISYVSSLQSREWSCGVCHQSIDGDYGAYTCDKCGDYAVHSRCGMRKDVCDGIELEGVPEEDDITQDIGPFDMISKGVILHFLHPHHLLLEVDILYDENKFCQACAIPIYEGNLYSCMECDFILHETCANAPRRIQHALHPHPLTLKTLDIEYSDGAFKCDACERVCGGFTYQCRIGRCDFDLDVRCALISEPFNYKGHEHPLFLALNPTEKPICHICKTEGRKQLNCIKCKFIVCFKCVTLPYKARYQHEEHFLTFLYGERVCEKDWCEVCERNFGITKTKAVYCCNECCTTFHTKCLLGGDLYLKPGQFFKVRGKDVQILRKSNVTRPICDYCENPCQGKIFKRENCIACCTYCLYNIVYSDLKSIQ